MNQSPYPSSLQFVLLFQAFVLIAGTILLSSCSNGSSGDVMEQAQCLTDADCDHDANDCTNQACIDPGNPNAACSEITFAPDGQVCVLQGGNLGECANGVCLLPPGVILEVISISNPEVEGVDVLGTCSVSGNECFDNDDCPAGEFCDIPIDPNACTINDWQVALSNKPLNESGNSTHVVVNSVMLQYAWLDGVTVTPDRVILLGTTIEANNQAIVSFAPISSEDLVTDNTTVSVEMIFDAETNMGNDLEVSAGAQLFIEEALVHSSWCVPGFWRIAWSRSAKHEILQIQANSAQIQNSLQNRQLASLRGGPPPTRVRDRLDHG